MVDLDALAKELSEAGIDHRHWTDGPMTATPGRKSVLVAEPPGIWVSEHGDVTAENYGRFTPGTWIALAIIRRHIEEPDSMTEPTNTDEIQTRAGADVLTEVDAAIQHAAAVLGVAYDVAALMPARVVAALWAEKIRRGRFTECERPATWDGDICVCEHCGYIGTGEEVTA